MPYGELIKQAFQIARQHRFLWVYGIFAGIPGFNFSVQWSDDSGSPHLDPAVVAAIVLGVLALGLVVLALSAISQGALAESVAAIQHGEQRGFRAAWRAGRATFWRVLGVTVLAALCLVAALLVLALPVAGVLVVAFVLTHVAALRVLAVIGAVLVALPSVVALFTAFVAVLQLGVRSAVLAGTPVVESVRAGWRLARRNPLPAFLFLLIQQGIAFGVFFVLAFALVVAALPAVILFLAVGTAAGITATAITLLVAVPAAFAVVGAVGTFGHALWTLGYLRLEPGTPAQD